MNANEIIVLYYCVLFFFIVSCFHLSLASWLLFFLIKSLVQKAKGRRGVVCRLNGVVHVCLEDEMLSSMDLYGAL